MQEVMQTIAGGAAMVGIVAFCTVAVAELVWFIFPSGPFRRGLPVWSEPLSDELVEPLRALPELTRGDWGWARRQGDQLLVRADPNRLPHGRILNFRTSWPYVALVDLEAQRVQFRQPIGVTLVVLPHLVLLFPFAALLFALNHGRQAPSIRAALEVLAEESTLAAGRP